MRTTKHLKMLTSHNYITVKNMVNELKRKENECQDRENNLENYLGECNVSHIKQMCESHVDCEPRIGHPCIRGLYWVFYRKLFLYL